MADNQVDLKLNLDFQGVNDALYQMIGQFKGTDKEFLKITNSMEKNAKNFEAAVKLFGPASVEAGRYLKALQKDFISLAANGVDPASNAFKKMTASMPTPAGLDAATGSLRKNNMQWTNLALVLQDLPFGFRGIQNNLPALVGGFAAATGPIYLGISAVIALITAWDLGMFKAKKTTDQLKQSQDDLNKALSNSKNDYYANELLLTNYVRIARDANSTDTQRKNAISEVNKVLKDYGIKLDENTIKTGKSEEAIKKVTEAMLNQALIAAYKDDYVALVKILDKEKELAGQAKKTAKASETVSKDGLLSYQSLSKEIDVTSLATKTYTNEADRQWMNQEQVVLNAATAVEKVKSKILELQKIATAGIIPGTGGGKNEPKPKDTYAKDFLDAVEAEQKLFKQNLDNQLAYAEGNDVKKVELLQKAMADLVAWHEQGIIEESFYQNTLADLYRQTYNIKEGLLRKELAEKEKLAREAEVIDNRQLQNSLDSLKIQSDVAMKIANLSGNATAADRIKILEEYKAGLYDLASVGGYTAEQFDKIDDALKRVDAAIDGSKDKVKDFSISWQETSNTINGILTNLVRDSIVKFSENIGKALAGEGTNPFEGFGLMIADAAIGIGKALIAYGVAITAFAFAVSNPFAAIAAGAALVIAGSYLKSRLSKQSQAAKPTAFADGGIISGPTMGLMGEYPGASHNPEVVAPLDKLKSLIGSSGGGTLEARISGNDLLILMNKAGRTNNNTF
jgi:hypothetical protein